MLQLLSPSSCRRVGPLDFSPSPIVAIISRLHIQFHTTVSQSRFDSVAKFPLHLEPKAPEKTTALMPKGMKKAFRAMSGINCVVRVLSEVSAAHSVTVTSVWMVLCPSFILRPTCSFQQRESERLSAGFMASPFSWPASYSSAACINVVLCISTDYSILRGNVWLHGWYFLFVKQNIDTKTPENSFSLFIQCLQVLCVITLFSAVSHSGSESHKQAFTTLNIQCAMMFISALLLCDRGKLSKFCCVFLMSYLFLRSINRAYCKSPIY